MSSRLPRATFAAPRSLFVRPSNMWLTHPLQSLKILSHLARKSDGKVIRFHVPREPDQQRMLNFASITFETPERATNLVKEAHKIRIPLNSRIVSDYAALLTRRTVDNRGIGLKEVAALVGLELDVQQLAGPSLSTSRDGRTSRSSSNSIEDETLISNATPDALTANQTDSDVRPHRAILATVNELVHDDVFDVELKLERRQSAEERYKVPQPRSLPGTTNGTGSIEALRASLDSFKGFGGRLRSSSLVGRRHPRERQRPR